MRQGVVRLSLGQQTTAWMCFVLPRLQILQVGDIHLPGTVRHTRNVDDKDTRFPPDLKLIVSSYPTKQVFKQIYRLLSQGPIAAIVFMGDLRS